MGATLAELSEPSQRSQTRIEIQGEAIVRGEHTLYMIVESSDEARAAGIHAAIRNGRQSRCVSGSDVCQGGCRAAVARPQCQPSMLPYLPSIQKKPANRQSMEDWSFTVRIPSIARPRFRQLIGGVVMPNPRFYVRNHFQIPKLDQSSWRLKRRWSWWTAP